ncbi:MAG: polysaccharide biosynthesis/export family protein [Planctomycetota bacterium]
MEERDRNHATAPHKACRALFAALLLAAGLGGCHWDSYIDPSVVGRWERTPTIVPILEHIAEIEEGTGEFSEFTEVQPEDLLPEPATYSIAAGDIVTLQLWDLVVRGQPVVETNVVDSTGAIDVIQIGRVEIAGFNEQQAAQVIAERMAPFVADPLVSVTVESRREEAFQMSGAVARPGAYAIPSGDYRLLEAVITAGGVAETAPYLYIIRQVSIGDDRPARPDPLSNDAGTQFNTQPFPTAPIDANPRPSRPEDADVEDLIDIIDDLSSPDPAFVGSPSAFGGASGAGVWGQPGEAPEPVIDLVEESSEVPPPAIDETEAPTRWIFRNGEWVQVAARHGQSGANGDGLGEAPAGLLTQRIIRIPMTPVLNGDARYNIVVRPGDVIRVPPAETGNVYLGGQIARPGVYSLPVVGRLTLTRAIFAAGGLGGIAIPERVDLTRMVGSDRQATVMLNYRAIAEGTQPDVFLKRDDVINIGTNFWAFPLAVVRNGFRASYGFGFLLDRNFGTDVFGAPVSNSATGSSGRITIF